MGCSEARNLADVVQLARNTPGMSQARKQAQAQAACIETEMKFEFGRLKS